MLIIFTFIQKYISEIFIDNFSEKLKLQWLVFIQFIKNCIIIYSIIFFSFDLLYWTWFNVRTIQKRYLKLLPITNLLKWRWNYSGRGWFLLFNFLWLRWNNFVVLSFLLLMAVSGCKICLFNKLLVVHQWVVIERKIFSK